MVTQNGLTRRECITGLAALISGAFVPNILQAEEPQVQGPNRNYRELKKRIHENPFKFIKEDFSDFERDDFETFTIAYEYARKTAKKKRTYASREIFYSANGRITKEYKREDPELSLENPSFTDLVYIYVKENRCYNGERLNLPNIYRLGQPTIPPGPPAGGPGALIWERDGEMYYFDSRTRVYSSKSGKKFKYNGPLPPFNK